MSGDGDVDQKDVGLFGETFMRQVGDAEFNEDLDFDGDGDVDAVDFLQIRRRLFQRTR